VLAFRLCKTISQENDFGLPDYITGKEASNETINRYAYVYKALGMKCRYVWRGVCG
jgi:hypothetical protein